MLTVGDKLHVVLNQIWDVFPVRTERGYLDGDRTQPIKKIFPKTFVGKFLFQIRIRCSHNTECRSSGVLPPTRKNRPASNAPSNLAWVSISRSPTSSSTRVPPPACSSCPGVISPLFLRQKVLAQCFQGQCAKIDFDKWSGG